MLELSVHWDNQIEQYLKVVNRPKRDSQAHQKALWVFFCALLAVEAGRVVIRSLSRTQFPLSSVEIAFSFLNPLADDVDHRGLDPEP